MKGPDMQGAAGVGGRGVQLGEKEVLEGGGQRACGARRKSSRGRVSNQKKKMHLASVSHKWRYKQVLT